MVLLKAKRKKEGNSIFLVLKKDFFCPHPIITWCAMFLEMSLQGVLPCLFRREFFNCQYGFIFTEVILSLMKPDNALLVLKPLI
jgi:hypothetical protein